MVKIARDFAGFTPGRGELLWRALGNKNSHEAIQPFRTEFIEGALARGVPLTVGVQAWQMIAGFAGYSFSKAHAAAFAVIVYWSAWLRVHFPVEYFCGLLRNAPLGTYPANVLESEARRSGVKFLPFDINRSQVKATVEQGTIRFGLEYVKGIGEARAEAIVQARGNKPFRALADFILRTGLERRPIEALILAGTFDRFGERPGCRLPQAGQTGGSCYGTWRKRLGLPIARPNSGSTHPTSRPTCAPSRKNRNRC